MVSLRTVTALVGIHLAYANILNEYIMKLKVSWKSNLLPSRTQLVLTSLCHVLWLDRTLLPYLLFQQQSRHVAGQSTGELAVIFLVVQ